MADRPKRVLSVGSVPPEWGGPLRGGVATFHRSLVEGLAPGTGRAAEVVALVTPTPLSEEAPVPGFALGEGQNRRAFLGEVVDRTQPDVIALNHFTTANAVLLSEVAPDVPLVGIAHSWHAITEAEPDAAERHRATAEHVLPTLAAMVSVSDHCRREGEALGFGYLPQTEVIPYPLQPAFAEPLDVSSSPRRGVVFVGSLQPRKNPRVLVEAAPLLPGLPFVLAGIGEEEATLRREAEALGVADRVRFVLHGPESDHLGWLRGLLASAEVMCLPSRSESFGLVYIEALACGTPVVGFEPPIAEIEQSLGISCGAGLKETTPPAVAAAIEEVLAGSWDREELRDATLRAYGLAAAAEGYAGVFAKVSS